MRRLLLSVSVIVLAMASPAWGQILIDFIDDPLFPGFDAEAEFTVIDPTTLQVRVKNTSTGNGGFTDPSQQLLTGVSWDFGKAGFNGDVEITGGSVVIGAFSQSLNFDTGNYGPGTDVSGEHGYGNMDGTGALTNFITAHKPQSTPFGGLNLDGPVNIDGPSAGLAANPIPIPLGGQSAIQDEVIYTLILSEPITEDQLRTDFANHGLRAEFGSDKAFLTPEPSTLAILALGGALLVRRRRS